MEQPIIGKLLLTSLFLLLLQVEVAFSRSPAATPITGTDERDPSKITLKHSIAYHFVRHTRSVEADLFVSRKINLAPIAEGLNTIQEVEERVSNLCATIPRFLREAVNRQAEAAANKPIFYHAYSEASAPYWQARSKCEALGLQLPEIYSEAVNREFIEFLIDNKIPYTFAGTEYDWGTLVHRLQSTGIPIWNLYQKNYYLIGSDYKLSSITYRDMNSNADARFLYTQKDEILVYYETLRGSTKHTGPRDNNDFQEMVAPVVCQLKWTGKSPVTLKDVPHGWNKVIRALPDRIAMIPAGNGSSRSHRQVRVSDNVTTPIQDFCYSVSKHMTETLERSSTRLSNLLALVDVSIDTDFEETEKVKRDFNSTTNATSVESDRVKRDLLKTGRRLFKVGKTVTRLSRAGPLFGLTTGFRAVWSLFGFIEKIRTDRRLKSLERAVSRNTEAIDQLSKEVASHSIAIDELNLVTQELTQRLNALTSRVENLERKVALIETEMRIQQILSFIDSLIERTQDALEYGFVKLESIIHNALSNQASAYLIPPDKLQDIQTQLSRDTSGLVDGDYSRMKSVVVAHPDDPTSLLAIVNLAALSRKSKELVQLTAMPTYRDEIAIFPQLDYHTVLLDQEGGTFTVIENAELSSCLADRCITSNPELPIVGSSCGMPQFFERQLDTCSYDEKVSDGLFLKRLLSDGVVFSVKEETRACLLYTSDAADE